MLDEVLAQPDVEVDFWEVAPENWMKLGGRYTKQLSSLTSRYPFTTHGLSLSIGSSDPLDEEFVNDVCDFLNEHNINLYSEHLSYCSSEGHMYDLMPIPFSEQAAQHTADRIKRVQDIIQRPLIVENVSYYAAPSQRMTELAFTQRVLELADCQLLLDVNNVYVNATNHGYDAKEFIAQLPTKRVVYGHIAGHYQEAPDLLIDTHGADVPEPVWSLLDYAYQCHGVFPTLVERDFNIPPLNELLEEVRQVRYIQDRYLEVKAANE